MASPVDLVISGSILTAVSGLSGFLFRQNPSIGQRGAALCLLAGALTGSAGAMGAVIGGCVEVRVFDWSLPFGPAAIGIDPLTGLFLLLIFLVAGCCAIYGIGYWPAERRGLPLFFGILAAALSFVALARNGVLFLLAWEVMALANYLLLVFESERKEVAEAGRVYLISTHIGTLFLFALFALLRIATGSFQFPDGASLSAGTLPAGLVFGAALLGFGLKAGIMPLHVWLPGAHANAPSHVSALMSGVVIKMGIYGILRTLTFFQGVPLWWGVLLLLAGIVSGIAGVVFAIAQHDLKRLLAYHSIENIGIIVMGIGVGLVGISIASPPLIVLGFAGALLHVLNHGIFKSLLFLGAGAAIHASGTREIDRMGGLGRVMPWTTLFFFTGAIAICGLPPLNGFVSELLIYLGLFSGVRGKLAAVTPLLALAVPALALIGGLALACFVKVCGAVFLGVPRTCSSEDAHEPGPAMLAPMALLALLCLLIGMVPAAAARLLEPAIQVLAGTGAAPLPHLGELAPLTWVTLAGFALAVVALLLAILFRSRLRAAPRESGVTWDCGYLAPAARMQYSSSSFAEILVKLFSPLLRPRLHLPSIRDLFPKKGSFESHVPEVVLELVMVPLFRKGDRRLVPIRKLQSGQLPVYILYVFVTLLCLLAWAA